MLENEVTSIDNCWQFANYTNTFRNFDLDLAQKVFVTSVRCMFVNHHYKIKADFDRFEKTRSSVVYAKVCDHFNGENGLLHTLMNDVNSWNTKYSKEIAVGQPKLVFNPWTFYFQKAYLIYLLKKAESIVPRCSFPFPSFFNLFSDTKTAVDVIVLSGPPILPPVK